MSALSILREKIKGFYGQYSSVINMGVRFLLSMIVLLSINSRIGYNTFFASVPVIVEMSVLAALTNVKFLVFLSAAAVFANCMSLGWDIGAISAAVMLVLLILFVVFVPGDASAIVITPLCLMFGVPALAPIGYGLKRNPASLAAVIPGAVMYYFIDAVEKQGSAIRALEQKEFLERIQLLSKGFTDNKSIVLTLVAMCVVLIIVYAIRRLSVNFSWWVAVIIGGALYIVMVILTGLALDIEINLTTVLIGAAFSIVLGLIFVLFTHNVKYSMSEKLTFEDDDYYYYVKAIPKTALSQGGRVVQTITGNTSNTSQEIAGGDLEEKLEDSLDEL